MITASLVTYQNDQTMVLRCIRSLLDGGLDRLYVVDNSPDDHLKDCCIGAATQYVGVGVNLGFGKAHNIGMQKAIDDGSSYHIVVNPDVYFQAPTLHLLQQFMDSRPDIGLVMPQIRYPDGSIQRLCKLLPSPWHVFARRFLPFWAKKLNINYQLEYADYDTSFECPSLSGCFMFLRTEVLKTVGLFDERFFMYFEDVDLVRRIGLRFQTVYWPGAMVTHHYEKGSYASRKLLLFHLVSAIKYFNKWGWFWDSHRKKVNYRTLARLAGQPQEVSSKNKY